MSTTVFKRRPVSDQQVAIAEAAAASAPIVGDPRIAAEPSPGPTVAGGALDFQIGRVYDVPLEKIRSNPLNPRVVYTSQAVDEMALSLASKGQRVPATGYVADDWVVLIEGETRLRGARAAGLKTLRIEIQVQPPSDKELYTHARDANVRRREQTPLDDALKWKELLAKKVFTSQAELARTLEIPESSVSRTLALANLSNRIVMLLADHPSLLNFQMLNAIREYSDAYGEEATLDYIPLVERNGWGYRQVAAEAARSKKGPVKRPRAFSEAIQYAGGQGQIKLFDGGKRLEVALKGVDPDKAQELVNKIKEICSNA